MLKQHFKVIRVRMTNRDECWEPASWTEIKTIKWVVGLHSSVTAIFFGAAVDMESNISNVSMTVCLAQYTFLHDNNNNNNNNKCKA